MVFFDDLPPISTAETPKDELEKAITALWNGRMTLIIDKKTAIELSGYEIDLIEEDNHFLFSVRGNVSTHDKDMILSIASRIMGEQYFVRFKYE